MKSTVLKSASVALVLWLASPQLLADPLSDAITYQGQLLEAGVAVNDTADLIVALMDAEVGGGQVAPALSIGNVSVVDGLFTVDLDFGPGAFDANARWLEIAVRSPAGSGSYTTLTPRQPVTAAPVALYALNAPAGSSPWQLNGSGVYYDAGSVGIGTTSPGGIITNSMLDVVGGHIALSNNYGVFSYNNGGTGIGAGMDTTTDDGLSWYAGGASRVSVSAAGDVGIGTAAPAEKLDVRGHLDVIDTRPTISLANTSNGEAITLEYYEIGDELRIQNRAANGDTFESTIAAFEANGNVGIGTVAPVARLEVVETGGFDPALSVTHNSSGLAIEAIQQLGSNACAKFEIGSSTGTGQAIIATTIGAGSAASFSQSNSTALQPTVAINAFGDNPNHFGLSVVTNNSGTAASFLCNDTGGTGDGVSSRVRGSGDAGFFQAEGVGTALVANNTSVGHIARFQDAGVDQVVIDSQGDLGIGTSSPAYQLDVRDASTSSNVVNIERTEASVANADLLQIEAHIDADDNTQFIECERGSDVEFRVWGDGDVTADGTYSGPADFAEMMHVPAGADTVSAGDVMIIDVENPRALRQSTSARSTLVAGIYSTKPGYLGAEHDWDEVAKDLAGMDPINHDEAVAIKPIELGRMIDEIPLAVVGIVPCKVSAENGAIKPGDLLVTSNTPGHAMRDDHPRNGAIVGKALGSLESGTGVITVLVTLQ